MYMYIYIYIHLHTHICSIAGDPSSFDVKDAVSAVVFNSSPKLDQMKQLLGRFESDVLLLYLYLFFSSACLPR